MSFGPLPPLPAHDSLGQGLIKPRDREIETMRPPKPSVPRTLRAKPRANSCGALKKIWSSDCNGKLQIFAQGTTRVAVPDTPSRSSESRRPRDDNPFGHARVNCLLRERESVENQTIPVGPRRVTDFRDNYSKSHVLGREHDNNVGVPVGDACISVPDKNREVGRRNNISREFKSAEQKLEWVPNISNDAAAAINAVGKNFRRIDLLKREESEKAAALDVPAIRPPGCTSKGGDNMNNYGRRNVFRREQFTDEGDFPTPRGADGYGKKNLMERAGHMPIMAK